MIEKRELLKVEHLSVWIQNGSTEICVLRDVSFSVREGERWAIAGESGAGKSMTMNAIAALLPEGSTKYDGRILFRLPDDSWQDLLTMPYRQRRAFLSEQIAIIFQDSINALNPNERIRKQWGETVRLHRGNLPPGEVEEHLIAQMEIFGIRGGAETLRKYPDQLSGGKLFRLPLSAFRIAVGASQRAAERGIKIELPQEPFITVVDRLQTRTFHSRPVKPSCFFAQPLPFRLFVRMKGKQGLQIIVHHASSFLCTRHCRHTGIC